MRRPALLSEHFELLFYVYLWAMASLLAVLVGRPALAAVGAVTVAPFVAAYLRRAR